MRTIKFRAWTGFKMEYSLVVGELGAFYVNLASPNKDTASLSEFNTKYDKSVPIMQFTGLTDKSGKEIYEGDILKCNWNDDRYPIHNIGPVEWNEREACWKLGEGGTAKDDAEAHFEVIGNIYENPELLEVEG